MAVYIGHTQFNIFSDSLNAHNLNDDVRNSILESFKEVTKYSPENMKLRSQKNAESNKKYIEKKKEEGVNARYLHGGKAYYERNKERLNKRKVELARLKREATKQPQSQSQSPHEVNFNGVISV